MDSDLHIVGIEKGEEKGIEFRTIDRFPGYRFGSDGTIWTQLDKSGAPRGQRRLGRWRQLRQSIVLGYLKCGLKDSNGGRKIYFVHRIILEAFVGPCPKGWQCCHADGCRTNNRIDNLRWGTCASNAHDRITHGTMPRGERSSVAKLTDESVREIRTRLASGEVARTIAADFGVHKNTIYCVRDNIVWRHVK